MRFAQPQRLGVLSRSLVENGAPLVPVMTSPVILDIKIYSHPTYYIILLITNINLTVIKLKTRKLNKENLLVNYPMKSIL